MAKSPFMQTEAPDTMAEAPGGKKPKAKPFGKKTQPPKGKKKPFGKAAKFAKVFG